ncbi:unnamed protein product [Heterobilharzia americana]|nr:unnamed protein product [Heterobilharzia americana]CAH8530193.1 unnamed protein product [Heterobilharzia americana]
MKRQPCKWFWYICPECRKMPALRTESLKEMLSATQKLPASSNKVGLTPKDNTERPGNRPRAPAVGTPPRVGTILGQVSIPPTRPQGTSSAWPKTSTAEASTKPIPNTPHTVTEKQPVELLKPIGKSGVPPTTNPGHRRTNSIILFNVDVSTDSLLVEREQFDSRMWTDYCQMLGLPPLPATLCRLSRGSHAPRDKPPPLRVSLNTAKEAEDTLLLSRQPDVVNACKIRARPDKPWSIREEERKSAVGNPNRNNTIVVHGIPELPSDSSVKDRYFHDVQQWQWLSTKVGLNSIPANSVSRLPRPAHLKTIPNPRLLAVQFDSYASLTDVLHAWYNAKDRMGGSIRICESKPRPTRQEERRQPPRPLESVVVTQALTSELDTSSKEATTATAPTQVKNKTQKNGTMPVL